MRSTLKHGEWEKQLWRKQIVLNGANDLNYNFELIKDDLKNGLINKKSD